MCGMTLNANGARPPSRSGGGPSSPARTPASSSASAAPPAPDTDWNVTTVTRSGAAARTSGASDSTHAARERVAQGEQHEVELVERGRRDGNDGQRAATKGKRSAGTAIAGDQARGAIGKVALLEDRERGAAHEAGGAEDARLEAHGDSRS